MSIIRITEDDVETFTIVANPKKEFASASNGVLSGTQNLFAVRSDIEKDTARLSGFANSTFEDDSFLLKTKRIGELAKTQTNISETLQEYMSSVNSRPQSQFKSKQINIFRFEPSLTFTQNTLKKSNIQKSLYPFYRVEYPDAHWAYTNYHCLNFFTASSVPSDSVLMYPVVSSSYRLPGAFTFEFWINPKHTTDEAGGDFKAGTVFHLSSSYAISLVSGSSVDSKGFVDGYKIKLQLSHSADVPPSEAASGAFPNDLIFETSDNALKRNHWHHVAIRWGTNLIDNGTGSIYVDGNVRGTFVVPSSSIDASSTVLSIGNFFEGSQQEVFFNTEQATREGLVNLASSFTQYGPSNYSLAHPLNAEVHDLRIYKSHRTLVNLANDRVSGPANLNGLAFYLGPFFTKESPFRNISGEQGGVLRTPFHSVTGTTTEPFNTDVSFGVGGHYLNTENFLRDLATGVYPRQLELSASVITDTFQTAQSANQIFYQTGSVAKRNLTILPCDNGKFTPNYELLRSGTNTLVPNRSHIMSKFVNDLGNLDLSLISLNDMVTTSSLRSGLVFQSGSIFDGIVGSTPESPAVTPGNALAVYQRTRDETSQEVSFFEISNLYFGNRIKPESFLVYDNNISGSDGKVSLSFRDNGYGNLYRADALTEHAKWNSVGNVFYNEGIVAFKSPNVPFFGQDQFNMEFKGEQTIHVLMLSADAAAGLIDSSSNPNYLPVSSSANANDPDKKFVYITNIDWMDDNFNVVMKTNLSQPIKKRTSDKVKIKAKMDF